MVRYLRHADRLLAALTRDRETDRLAAWGLPPETLRERVAASAAVMGPLLAAYGREVSSPDMAVSLRSATLLGALCEMTRPARVLDTGSGFSSWVLRRYAAERGGAVEVWSVDDDAGWMAKTGVYLRAHGLDDERLLLWDAFAATDAGGFDLVFHDLGQARGIRLTVLPEVCARLADGGMILLDDFHKRRYGGPARRMLAGSGLESFPLRHHTLDDLGRFAALARRAA